MEKEEYIKTWKYYITFIPKKTPKNFISGKPIYILGIRTPAWLWKVKKSL